MDKMFLHYSEVGAAEAIYPDPAPSEVDKNDDHLMSYATNVEVHCLHYEGEEDENDRTPLIN